MRSIPARAGEPSPCAWLIFTAGVYPRASGGAFGDGVLYWAREGLSPRERGSLPRDQAGRHQAGSIPARAGEPPPGSGTGGPSGVYPRASGGAAGRAGLPGPCVGLSPRERGSLPRRGLRFGVGGSIPARAGEPASDTSASATGTVYPRASGGADLVLVDTDGDTGLSPRERGSPWHRGQRNGPAGSIPARAGEPPPTPTLAGCAGVYPRASGGAVESSFVYRGGCGLSPRERGSHRKGKRLLSWVGSIPARAGEPAAGRANGQAAGVYPRASGGAEDRSGHGHGQVYPRASGGASTRLRVSAWDGGLSPRERGSR